MKQLHSNHRRVIETLLNKQFLLFCCKNYYQTLASISQSQVNQKLEIPIFFFFGTIGTSSFHESLNHFTINLDPDYLQCEYRTLILSVYILLESYYHYHQSMLQSDFCIRLNWPFTNLEGISPFKVSFLNFFCFKFLIYS